VAPQTSSRAARNTVSPAFDPVDASGTEPLVAGGEVEPGEVDEEVLVVDAVDVVVEVGGSVAVVVVLGGGAVVVVVADPVTSISRPSGSVVPPSLSVTPKKAV
jgi:hypothetical protein